jgi:hypothetical protein
LRVIWVLENIEEDKKFYGKLNTLLLFASVTLWKKHHPDTYTVFYCDKMTYELFESIKVLHLWNEVNIYKHERKINRSVFWAASKLNVLAEQTEPVLLLDNDSLVHTNIDEYLKDEVIVSNFEIGKGYYPSSLDTNIRNLTYKARWKSDSVNVSFLYLPDPTFTQEYAKLSLKLMEEFTVMEVPNSQYLIFAEQLLLKHLLDKNNIKHKSVISTYWDCQKWDWSEDHNKGIWNYPESNKYFFHYGPLKGYIKAETGDLDYQKEIDMLENCIGFRILDESIFSKR